MGYFALLTTVYLASARQEVSLQISSQCYEAGKGCLEAHLHWFPRTKRFHDGVLVPLYLSYNLLYAALSPVITVFVHAIAHADRHDVELLRQFEASLTSGEFLQPSEHPQTERDRIVRICSTFRRVAEERLNSTPLVSGTIDDQHSTSVEYDALTNLNTSLITSGFDTDANNSFPSTETLQTHVAMSPEPIIDLSAFFNEWINDPHMNTNFFGFPIQS